MPWPLELRNSDSMNGGTLGGLLLKSSISSSTRAKGKGAAQDFDLIRDLMSKEKTLNF